MGKILEVKDLYKSYGKVQAVKGISFYVETGKLFAFLGPNGAGKSTTIDILCTLLQPDSGQVQINGNQLGKDDAGIRRDIGVVFQDSILDPLLTVEENLMMRGSLYPMERGELRKAVVASAQAAGVTDFFKRRYGKLSGGQRRRADIARALVHTPKILFLDEPTTGLDPQTRKAVWETVRQLQAKHGMTVFLTTHYMEEAAEADYVMVIDDGLIAARGTPSALREQYSGDTLKLRTKDMGALSKTLDGISVTYRVTADTAVIRLSNTLEALPILEACKTHLEGLEVASGTMDDAFIAITGKEIRS